MIVLNRQEDLNKYRKRIKYYARVQLLFIGQFFALANGKSVELDSPAFIENSRTYLPLRFVAENLGAMVVWDAKTQKVTIVH